MASSRLTRAGRPGWRSHVTIALAAVLIATLALVCAGWSAPPHDAAARRMALLRIKGNDAQAIASFTRALQDRDPIVARTAARLLARCGKAALPHLKRALRSPDLLLRRIAVTGLGEMGAEAVEPLAAALEDPHPLVRQAAVFALARVRPHSPRVMKLLTEAGKDEDQAVRDAALNAAKGFFTTVDQIRLPREGWKFKLDPQRVGKDHKWFAVDFDDSGWDDIQIERAWTQLGYDYIGVAWYRRSIELPAKPEADRAVLAFEGVDECAWVWINGQYAGEHDIGPSGWDKPFRLDATDLLRWGEQNQITVRAMNTAAAGGIWQPVTIMALKLAE